MSAINTSQQPTPPNVHTATKRAVATDVDPPRVDDTSPVQQRPLFASNSATAAPQDLFEDLASDEESPESLLPSSIQGRLCRTTVDHADAILPQCR